MRIACPGSNLLCAFLVLTFAACQGDEPHDGSPETGGPLGGAGGASGAGGQAGMNCLGQGGRGGGPSGNQVQPRGGAPAVGCNNPGTMPGTKQDECACADLVCPDGQTCLEVFSPPPPTTGGPGNFFNGCFEICEQDSDCGSERVCAGTIYGVRKCVQWVCRRSDECIRDRCGECRLGYVSLHISGWMLSEVDNRCVYRGACEIGSCPGCLPHGSDAHACP